MTSFIRIALAVVVSLATGFEAVEASDAGGSAAEPEAPFDLAQLIQRCERAVVEADEAALRDIHAQLSGTLEREGGRANPAARYTYAYSAWRLNHLMKDEKGSSSKEGGKLLKQAQVVLEGLIEERPDDAEAHALLGSLLGEQIGRSMWRGIRLGPKAGGAMETAYGLDEENPRVALQRGISFLFTPRLFGGGLDKAEKELRRAEVLFARETIETGWPSWGRADTHVWLGQALMKKKDFVGARDEFNAVLALEPDYHWVSAVLLPALDEAEARAR